MNYWLERTELLVGKEALDKLAKSRVLVVGLGGVGSYAAEALVRAGIGAISLVDGDEVDPTNKNRQLQALNSTIGMAKAEVLKNRFLDIHPELKVEVLERFMEPQALYAYLSENPFDYSLDCIDSLLPKLTMILTLKRLKYPFISAMGAGGKMDPSRIRVADISNTRECKFAQQLKKMLKNKGVTKGIRCVYSEEIQPKHALRLTDGSHYKKSYYGTISYMPAMFGLTMASEVIRRIIDL
jgi:tRNA A37 threonylcarbamoyladenosine dehydratase